METPNEMVLSTQYNEYPSIIQYEANNPIVRSPNATTDLYFYQTKETLMDVDVYRNFLKNAESRFRASKEYKLYKHYLIEYLGIDRCQIFGNITVDDAEIELHHNVLGLFDICLLISSHIVNTIGMITTFDLVELLIQEHYANRVGVTFLSKTAHQKFTNDPDGYLPPDMTFGKWWELLSRYKYGITYDIANKVIKYINKYNKELPPSVQIMQNDEILSYSYYNEYGVPPSQVGILPYKQEFENQYGGSSVW
ncbi:MAG: hypothetical protein IKR19_07795 [Acholeplasmatales bacterium]|nr:hypothetical protein [Acholeplasmatales bacterium]